MKKSARWLMLPWEAGICNGERALWVGIFHAGNGDESFGSTAVNKPSCSLGSDYLMVVAVCWPTKLQLVEKRTQRNRLGRRVEVWRGRRKGLR